VQKNSNFVQTVTKNEGFQPQNFAFLDQKFSEKKIFQQFSGIPKFMRVYCLPASLLPQCYCNRLKFNQHGDQSRNNVGHNICNL